jgi:hypothetical protein
VTVPFFMLVTAAPCFGQITSKPTWAVVDFSVRAKKGGADLGLGHMAAQAVTDELSKNDDWDVLPTKTISRTVSSLNLVQPIDSTVSLLRLGEELKGSSINSEFTMVSGEVLNYRVVADPSSKSLRGEVIIRVVATDLASGLPVNGAAVFGSSANQTGSGITSDMVLSDAVAQAASEIVSDIRRFNLPSAAVLNTYVENGRDAALVNEGSRSGFKLGQEVVVLRGSEQVALGRISSIEPDDATVLLVESERGIQPGDRIRAVFVVPDIAANFPRNGEPKMIRPHPHGNNTGFIQGLLVVGLLAFLFSDGRGTNDTLVTNVQAQAAYFQSAFAVNTVRDSAGNGYVPGVLITYNPDEFLTYNPATIVQAQAYRLDPANGAPEPVAVNAANVGGSGNQMADTGAQLANFVNTGGMGPVQGSTCGALGGGIGTQAGLPAFVSYQYEVEIIFKVNGLDLPVSQGTGECYFVTNKAVSNGSAMSMGQIPSPTNPNTNTQVNVNTPIQFQFPSILANSPNPFVADYIVEVSTLPTFPKGSDTAVFPSAPIQSTATNQITTPPTTLAKLLPATTTATQFFFRYGVRNDNDSPGPVPDASGERFLFSQSIQVPISQTTIPGAVKRAKGNVVSPSKKR